MVLARRWLSPLQSMGKWRNPLGWMTMTSQSTNTLIRSKVVIGDMDAPGAKAVVTSIIKNGGWVIVLTGRTLELR